MLTIHQMAERTGVTIRALRYYDKIGLLPPGAVSPAGYRLYGPAARWPPETGGSCLERRDNHGDGVYRF